ncbi:MAG: ATP-dependent DNA helicase, partial [Gemmatimonadaceae bacterium]
NGAPSFTAVPIRSTPVALFMRDHAAQWLGLSSDPDVARPSLTEYASRLLGALEKRGASFFQELVAEAGILPTQAELALGELVALGLVTADSFAGLRALLVPSAKRKPLGRSAPRRRHGTATFGVETAGRWSLLRATPELTLEPGGSAYRDAIEAQAWVLLHRYGVVSKRVIARETRLAPWRELLSIYRRLEARGEVRGGRFVSGLPGEQFALPEAVSRLRAVRRGEPTGELIGITAADPLNLTGIVTPGARIASLASNRVAYRDGVPIAARERKEIHPLADYGTASTADVERALLKKPVSPALRSYLRHTRH